MHSNYALFTVFISHSFPFSAKSLLRRKLYRATDGGCPVLARYHVTDPAEFWDGEGEGGSAVCCDVTVGNTMHFDVFTLILLYSGDTMALVLNTASIRT
jgi:hypothetical protein